MSVLLRPWRHYVDFNGRSGRSEFWLFKLTFWGALAFLVVTAAIVGDLSERARGEPLGGGAVSILILASVFYLAGILPGWALTVRRLHDQGKSGWMILLTFIPWIGFIFVLVFGCVRGDDFENEYGLDPRDGDIASKEVLRETFS